MKLIAIVSFIWTGIVLARSELVLPECGITCADKTCGAADINCFCKSGNSSINTFEQCIGTTCGPLDFQAAHSWVSSRCGRTEFGLLVQRACDVGEVACHSGCIPSDGVCCSSNSGWCDPGEACCNSGCMPDDGICCGSKYCYAGNYCCNNAQYTNQCVESSSSCCDSTETSCGSGCITSGQDCCPDGGYCDSGEECCDSGYCVPTGATCCGTGDGSYCDADQDCCNGKCIKSGATCCDAGMTACGDGCMPSGSVCCDNGAGYCDSGEACCNGKCLADSKPCCDSGWTACTTGCMPVGSVCCSDGGYCDAGLICSADKCWESSATSKPTTSISRASTTTRSATETTEVPTSAGFTATGGGLTLPTESASSGSVSSSSSVSFTSLTLVLTTVDIVTPTGPVSQPDLTNTPLYAGTGSLLGDECSTTEFTLIDAGSTVFFAPFVGCVSDRPECCPWTVGGLTTTITVTSNGATSVVTSTPPAGNHQDVAYPFALESGQQALGACPNDYYSISGSCCPSNYQPYGAALGGATPCFSSLGNYASPPTLTAGLAGQPTDTSQPTSAVINVVWAMQYEIKTKSDDLSTGAKAGIGVGVPVGAIALGLLGFVIWRQTRKRGDSDTATVSTVQSPPPQQMHQAPPGFPVYPAPTSNNSFAPTGTIPSQNTGGSMLSHNTQGRASELSGNGSNPHNSAYLAGAGAASYNNPPSFHGSGGGSPVYGVSNGQGQYPYNYNQQQAPSGSPPQQGQPFYPSGGSYEGQQYGFGGQGPPQPSPPHQPSHGPWYPPNPPPQR